MRPAAFVHVNTRCAVACSILLCIVSIIMMWYGSAAKVGLICAASCGGWQLGPPECVHACPQCASSAQHRSCLQVRFCVWLPAQLIGNLIAVAALPRMGALYEAAGAGPAASVIAWGALYHLTLGFMLPGALRRCRALPAVTWGLVSWDGARNRGTETVVGNVIAPCADMPRAQALNRRSGCWSWLSRVVMLHGALTCDFQPRSMPCHRGFPVDARATRAPPLPGGNPAVGAGGSQGRRPARQNSLTHSRHSTTCGVQHWTGLHSRW